MERATAPCKALISAVSSASFSDSSAVSSPSERFFSTRAALKKRAAASVQSARG
jgi:hypothetical protein